MNTDLNISLAGIPEERWTEREERCAECRKFFEETCGDEEDVNSLPLLLWRKDGHEMLKLCWPCATKRMSATETQSGAE